MLVSSSSRPGSAAPSAWARFGLNLLLFLPWLAGLFPAMAQTAEGNNSGGNQSAEQLTIRAESYERFLRGPLPSGTPRARVLEVQEQLGAVYFLLHRYRDSLNVLNPVLREQPHTGSSERAPAMASLYAQSWLVGGMDYLELNQLAEAIPALKRALAMQPTNANARLALGDALARSGRMEDAATEYEQQTKLTPSLADAWYKLGMAHSQISVEVSREKVKPAEQDLAQQLSAEELLAKGDNLNAARLLFRLLHRSPNQPEVPAELGSALLALGYAKAAAGHFHQELARNPESPLAQLGVAQTAALSGDWDEVGTTLEHLSKSEPREFTRLLEFPPAGLVIQSWSGGQMNPPASFSGSPAGILWKSWLSDSAVIARISAKVEEDSAHACATNLAQKQNMLPGTWLTEGCYEILAEQLKAKRGPSAASRIKLAESEFRLGHYDAALRAARLLRSADRLSGWGVYWLSKTRDALAEECFLKVGALNPDSARVHQMLAEHYTNLSDYPKAKTEFQNAIRSAPNSPDLHLGLGTVLSRTSDWAEAEKELRLALELAPESAFAHYRLGHVYLQQSLWEEAIEQLRQVPGDSTIVVSARLDLAKAESETGQISQAVEDLLSVGPLDHDGELYFRLAGLYRSLGDKTRAHDALATFKQLRAASLQTDKDELGALEKEQGADHDVKQQSP
jgi:tetratricopeptide (TPR) repeat protein